MRTRWLATLILPSLAFAQAPSTVKPPDLSGVWSVKGSPATRYLSWSFSKDEPPMTPWAEERFKLTKPSFGPRAVEDSNDPVNPTTLSAVGCFPPGMPRLYLQPFPLEIIQTPGRVIMLFEFSHFVRQIYTDGRKHNTDLGPTWLGDAIGHWDGDTLVVDTIGFNDRTFVDSYRTPHTDKLHVVERFRLIDGGNTLEVAFTVEDPGAFYQPWSGTRNRHRVANPNNRLTETACAEANDDYYNIGLEPVPTAEKTDF